MRNFIVLFKVAVVLLAIAIFTTGCSNQEIEVEKEINNAEKNPFKLDTEETVVMGAINHTFLKPEIDIKGQMAPLIYNGGELKIDYLVSASGMAKNIGFLIFINGVAQPYKLNSSESSYDFLHVMSLEEDDKENQISFIFNPVTGEKGETVSISITSIYNPLFIPDMKETSSYGGYHMALEAVGSIFLQQDPISKKNKDIEKNDTIFNLDLYEEPVTKNMLDEEEIDLESLDNRVFTRVNIWENEKSEVIHINNEDSIKVRFKVFGHPNVHYRHTFYINHKPISSKDGNFFDTEIKKGNVALIDLELNTENLEDYNTFYVISVPLNANDFPNDVIVLEKTPSVLLYK